MAKPKILIVDDVPSNIMILATMLDVDYELSFAVNGRNALDILESQDIDLIMLDVVMPEMDGFELCGKIKANPKTQAIPVLFTTARSDEDDIARGLALGAYYYLTKPFDRRAIQAITRAAVVDFFNRQALMAEIQKTSDTLSLLDDGNFRFNTLEQARNLAVLLSQTCSNPEQRVFGFTELLVNAVEHGNLGVTYEEKTKLNECNAWEAEVRRRLTLPENRGKYVTVNFHRTKQGARFLIKDMGVGFDWNPYLEMDPKRAFDSHGRGIAMSIKASFSQVTYCGSGNEVLVIV